MKKMITIIPLSYKIIELNIQSMDNHTLDNDLKRLCDIKKMSSFIKNKLKIYKGVLKWIEK